MAGKFLGKQALGRQSALVETFDRAIQPLGEVLHPILPAGRLDRACLCVRIGQRATVELAFQRCALNRVEIHVSLENRASQRVAEKIGLEREGVARGLEYVNGRYLDHIQFSILRSDVMDPHD